MLEFDEVGYWSQIKLDLVKKYAAAYSTAMAAQRNPTYELVYVDAIASATVHLSRGSRTYIPGSPVNILLITPGFYRYYLIDVRAEKTSALQQMVADNPRVSIIPGNSNDALTAKVFPHVQWNQYRRGLCLLDPYGLHLDWAVIEAAGRLKTLDVFLSFPVADSDGRALWRNPAGLDRVDLEQLTRHWGDDSWKDVAYESRPDSSGRSTKTDYDVIAGAFRERLHAVAKFKHVSEPLAMRGSKGAVNYYLFFASPKPVAVDVVAEIFDTYRARGSGR